MVRKPLIWFERVSDIQLFCEAYICFDCEPKPISMKVVVLQGPKACWVRKEIAGRKSCEVWNCFAKSLLVALSYSNGCRLGTLARVTFYNIDPKADHKNWKFVEGHLITHN